MENNSKYKGGYMSDFRERIKSNSETMELLDGVMKAYAKQR